MTFLKIFLSSHNIFDDFILLENMEAIVDFPTPECPTNRSPFPSTSTPDEWKIFLEVENQQIRGFTALEKELGVPVFIGSHYNPWESQVVSDLNKEGIRIYNRLNEVAQVLYAMHKYWENR